MAKKWHTSLISIEAGRPGFGDRTMINAGGQLSSLKSLFDCCECCICSGEGVGRPQG